MNYKSHIYIGLLISALFFTSCTKDKGPIIPELNISTVSFATDVQPIFDANCTVCHNTAASVSNGNLDLSEGNSYTELVNVVADAYAPNILVLPADSEASILVSKTNESGDFGDNMPLGPTALSATDQEIIRVWIAEGALDN